MPASRGVFARRELGEGEAARLAGLARQARGDILTMTTLARSGHPGGSMSSIDMYLTVWSQANVSPEQAGDPARGVEPDPERDRIVVSHGHTSPGVYATLAALGFVDREAALAHFRQAGSPFEGHVERHVPGVEWSTGNLGQGLSAACGMALAAPLTGLGFHTFCFMSDGEQTKGQVGEARRFAAKYGLVDLTVLVDVNDIQISGRASDIMPQDLAAHWKAPGWKVLEVDGHDMAAIHGAVHEAVHEAGSPVAILCRTVIGKGVPFIEDSPDYHGKALSREQYAEAMGLLGLEPRLEGPERGRTTLAATDEHEGEPPHAAIVTPAARVDPGRPRTYEPGTMTDNRSAWGAALTDLGVANISGDGLPLGDSSPLAVFDCDLAGSVKTDGFWKAHPRSFFQAGVQEHSTAAMAAALSTQGVLSFWADFGVFGIDETYNQHRLSDINGTGLKVVLTHCGLDVGEDGKTHQCIDYVGVLRNCFGWKVLVPADPNQTDRAVRWMATQPGNVALCVGRSKLPVVTTPDGGAAFGGEWEFSYGRATVVRDGADCALLAMGTTTHMACAVHDLLAERGVGCRVIDVPAPLSPDDDVMTAAVATGLIVTYEDHNAHTGLGASVAMWMAEAQEARIARLLRLGVTRYGSSGTPDELFARQGLDPAAVARRVLGTLRA